MRRRLVLRAPIVLALVVAGAAVPAGAQQNGPALSPLIVVPPPAVQRAVARGTRAVNGAPGPHYWQNGANYDIQARVSPRDSLLRGDETIVYFNRSPDTLAQVLIHLYQNLFAPGAGREQPNEWTTPGMRLDRLEAQGASLPIPLEIAGAPTVASGDTSRVIGTVLIAQLPRPLLPGDSASFHIQWHFTIPPADADRMGMQDATTAQVAQLYPQIAVYDDLHGWDAQQYTGTGEFYLDYGRFRYSVTLPAGFLVGGTGTLTDAEAVLAPSVREGLDRAMRTDEIVHAVTPSSAGGGTTTGQAGATLTWTFTADSVRDVAFSFSDHYLWEATRALVDSAAHRYAAVNVLYRPGASGFTQVAAMARSALESHSRRMVPYPYPQLTETEGGSGGMEYPMTVFVQAYADPFRLDGVTAHEIGHEWFPMLVGSDETRYGWQDEGLNTFDTFFATDDYFRTTNQDRGRIDSRDAYVAFAKDADEDFTMMSPANAFGVSPNSGYGPEAYDKPGSTLWALRSILGPDLFHRAYVTYIRRWAYRHPTPWDFFNTFADVTHQNLDWFWEPWFFTNERLDQAVTSVTSGRGKITVTVENVGGLYAPVDLSAALADGSTVTWREPASVWFGGARKISSTHAVSQPVTHVAVDLAGNFPDVDRTNNLWKKP
jgi:Peptidase family M1 domain